MVLLGGLPAANVYTRAESHALQAYAVMGKHMLSWAWASIRCHGQALQAYAVMGLGRPRTSSGQLPFSILEPPAGNSCWAQERTPV